MKPATRPYRRHIVLVDHVLQRSLLVALVIMEAVLVALAIWLLYRALGTIVDDHVYRIHFSGRVDIVSSLMSEVLRVLLGMLAVNVVALLVADRIWAFYVNRILCNLDRLMADCAQLNFCTPQPTAFQHVVLSDATAWRVRMAGELAELRDHLRDLPTRLPELTEQRDTVAAKLARLHSG